MAPQSSGSGGVVKARQLVSFTINLNLIVSHFVLFSLRSIYPLREIGMSSSVSWKSRKWSADRKAENRRIYTRN